MFYPWESSMLDPRKRDLQRMLRDSQSPETHGGVSSIKRSARTQESIAAYLAADENEDAISRAYAMDNVIEANRADHIMSGIPLHAHNPLPDEFAKQMAGSLAEMASDRRSLSLTRILDATRPDRRPVVRNQLSEALSRTDATKSSVLGLANIEKDPERDLPIRSSAETTVNSQGDPRGRVDHAAFAGENPQDPRRQPYKKIVKPYRRYAPPGGLGAADPELEEAEAIARDADATIRKITSRVLGNPRIEQSDHPFLREFAAAVRRYYAEDGDRAVAAVAPRLSELAVDAEDRYATYAAIYDRIYFTRLNRNQSDEEKIVTVIHEVLHATRTMKGIAARVGYDRAPKGSIVRAQHEAYVDNVAKAIAKQLGLIPSNYPPTDWRAYYRRQR